MGDTTTQDNNHKTLAANNMEDKTSKRRPLSWRTIVGPKLFSIHATLLLGFRTACYGYLSGILTTLERRFQLSSSEAGSLISVNDIAEICVILMLSHFGHNAHRPRWIAIGTITMGVGMFICAIPHFASNPLDPNAVILGINDNSGLDNEVGQRNIGNTGLCTKLPTHIEDISGVDDTTRNSTSIPFTQYHSSTIDFLQSRQPFNDSIGQCEKTSSNTGSVVVIGIGQIIVGVGAAPMFPLIMSYLHDNVDSIKFTSYTACIFMAFAIGPPLGLLMGAWAVSFYVDFNRIESSAIPDIPTEDPRWIGAWWLGFVVCFIGLVLVGIPMSFYPKTMNGDSIETDEETEVGTIETTMTTEDDEQLRIRSRQKSRGSSIFEQTIQVTGILRSLKRLFTNRSLTMLCIGLSAELAMIGILGSFGIKYMQTQYGLSATGAASIFGCILVPVSILSNIASAYICRRFQFKVSQCAWMAVVGVSLSVPVFPILMFVGCLNSDVAGVNVEYSALYTDKIISEDHTRVNGGPEESICNANCRCPDEIFQPVCGANGVTYISPCHAGCTAYSNTTQWQMTYSDCSCINQSFTSNSTAESGLCNTECPVSRLIVFVLAGFMVLFSMALIQNPVAYIIMRLVHKRDRSIAVGWKLLVTKCLGYFPAPVYFGAIINSTCTLWQFTCGDRGSCWLYNIVSYRYAFFGTLMGLRCFAIVLYLIMIWCLKPDQEYDDTDQMESSNGKEKIRVENAEESQI